MLDANHILDRIDRSLGPFKKGAAILATLAGIGAAYWFWRTNIWQPKVKVLNVDFDKGFADVLIQDVFKIETQKRVYAGSAVSAGGNWAIQFVKTNAYSDDKPTRLELTKNDITYKTLNTAE